MAIQRWRAPSIQGSGTYGIEAVISSVIPRDGKLLIIINGAYGKRIRDMELNRSRSKSRRARRRIPNTCVEA